MIISMTLFAIITTSVLMAVENLSVSRIKTLNRVALLDELYFFSEQLFTGIKEGGTLDYEEYWNRQSFSGLIQSWHYLSPTGVGNYWKNGNLIWTYGTGIYLCRSNNWASNMWSWWCLTDNNNGGNANLAGASANFTGTYQRYGQYAAQFIDYNGNNDIDIGDEDTDSSASIIGDDDDRAIGNVPEILTWSMQELYLINKNLKKRMYFRWNIQQDPNSSTGCTISNVAGKIVTWVGCMGNVQVLKLKWIDVGLSHTWSTTDSTAFDGVIDTWICMDDGQCTGPAVPGYGNKNLATGADAEWFNLFPSSINVKNLSFRIYPVKDPWKSWNAPDCLVPACISPFIHPYVRMNLEMGFSWWKRRIIKNDDPTISISTSVSLSDFE